MLKAELEMLEGLKNALNAALIDYDRNHDPEPLYELIEEADALYGADVSEITSALEMAKHYNGTIKCQSMVILRLLQRKYIQEESAFQAGIMPITYENLRQYRAEIVPQLRSRFFCQIVSEYRRNTDVFQGIMVQADGKRSSRCDAEP